MKGWKTMLLRHVGVLQSLADVSCASRLSHQLSSKRLKMPQASRVVIIEETCMGKRGRGGGFEAKLRRGKLRAALGLRDEDDDARLPHASVAIQLCSW